MEQELIEPNHASNGFLEELIGTLELFVVLLVNDDRRVIDRSQWTRWLGAVTRNHLGWDWVKGNGTRGVGKGRGRGWRRNDSGVEVGSPVQ